MANYDAWRRCTPENTAKQGKRLWLGCNACARNVYIGVEDFCKASGISAFGASQARRNAAAVHEVWKPRLLLLGRAL